MSEYDATLAEAQALRRSLAVLLGEAPPDDGSASSASAATSPAASTPASHRSSSAAPAPSAVTVFDTSQPLGLGFVGETLVVGEVFAQSQARALGVVAGSIVVAIDGHAVRTAAELVGRVEAAREAYYGDDGDSTTGRRSLEAKFVLPLRYRVRVPVSRGGGDSPGDVYAVGFDLEGDGSLRVAEDGDGAAAAISAGSIVLDVDGASVSDEHAFTDALSAAAPGDGDQALVTVTLARPRLVEFPVAFDPGAPLGLTFEAGDAPVLARTAPDSQASWHRCLAPGAVLVEADLQPVRTPRDLAAAVAAAAAAGETALALRFARPSQFEVARRLSVNALAGLSCAPGTLLLTAPTADGAVGAGATLLAVDGTPVANEYHLARCLDALGGRPSADALFMAAPETPAAAEGLPLRRSPAAAARHARSSSPGTDNGGSGNSASHSPAAGAERRGDAARPTPGGLPPRQQVRTAEDADRRRRLADAFAVADRWISRKSSPLKLTSPLTKTRPSSSASASPASPEFRRPRPAFHSFLDSDDDDDDASGGGGDLGLDLEEDDDDGVSLLRSENGEDYGDDALLLESPAAAPGPAPPPVRKPRGAATASLRRRAAQKNHGRRRRDDDEGSGSDDSDITASSFGSYPARRRSSRRMTVEPPPFAGAASPIARLDDKREFYAAQKAQKKAEEEAARAELRRGYQDAMHGKKCEKNLARQRARAQAGEVADRVETRRVVRDQRVEAAAGARSAHRRSYVEGVAHEGRRRRLAGGGGR